MYLVRVLVFALLAGAAALVISTVMQGNGDWSRALPSAVGATIGTGIAFAFMFAATTSQVPGLTVPDAEARIGEKTLLKGYRRSVVDGVPRYTVGHGLFANHVELLPDDGGIKLRGARMVVNQLSRRLKR